jgi:hypothetical protein
MKKRLFSSPIFVSAATLAVLAIPVHAALVAYEGFDYANNQNLTNSNGGTGWSNDWDLVGEALPLLTSTSDESLAFSQSPSLISDGSNHIVADINRANQRNFSPAVDLATQPFYFTMLFRVESGADVVDMRAEFRDASNNMRGNVGISNGGLFVATTTAGYITSGSNYSAGLVGNDITYLLVMKRDTNGISASLINATGDLSDLASEPVSWQVSESGLSGVDLTEITFAMNGADGLIRADEMRIATTWADAVGGLAIPEPSSALLGLVGMLALIRRRRLV